MSQKSILIIDDDNDVKESTQVMLMDEGFKVFLACDGKQGVEAYLKNKPDMTFMDLKMPIMDGYEAFFKIKEKDAKAKIAFITGFSTDSTRLSEAKKKDLVDVIRKPVELSTLLKIINK